MTHASHRRTVVGWVLAGALALGLSAPAAAEDHVRHSGTVVSVSADGQTFVLAEVGPWRVREGKTVMTYRTITITPDTEYVIVARALRGPWRITGGFVEAPLESDGIYLNDHITVDCHHEARRMVALKISVIDAAGME